MRLIMVVVALWCARALAQDAAAGALEPVDAGVEAPPPPPAAKIAIAPAPPVPAAAPPPAAPAPLSARARMKGHLGFGFLGTSPVLQATDDSVGPITFPGAPAAPFVRISVPMVGVRWWTPLERLGLEVGLGVMVSTASGEVPVTNGSNITDGPTTTELLLHLSAPIVLGSTEHTIVFLAPELRVGRSTRTTGDPREPLLAMTWDASLKAGVEVFFSFIGLSNLSLEAGVRAGFTHEVRTFTVSSPLGGEPREGQRSLSRFATSLVANPWDLFTGTLAARYYF